MRPLAILMVLCGLSLTFLPPRAAHATPSMNTATVGSAAPDFTLTDMNGTARSLHEFKGRFVVLEWLNPECPFVQKHYGTGNMQKLQSTYTAKDVVWLSITSSAPTKQGYLTPAAAKEFVEETKATPTAVLLDHEGTVGKLYGARVTPHMFVIDREGRLIYAGAIDDNDSSRESTVAGAKNFVAAALDEAMRGSKVTMAVTEPYGCSVKYGV